MDFADAMLAKAVGISEVARMSRLESQMYRTYLAKWKLRSKSAASAAGSAARSGSKASAITAAVNREMAKWPKDVKAQANADVEAMYKLGRRAANRKAVTRSSDSLAYSLAKSDLPTVQDVSKAGGSPRPEVGVTFDVNDINAIEALQAQNMFWIGEHYGEHVAAAISTSVSEAMVQAGSSRAVTGELIRSIVERELGIVTFPSGFRGTAEQYFQGLAANTSTVARSYGQLRSFADIGVTKYVIVNPRDDRTCPVCSQMDGKVFSVSDGMAQMKAELEADSPEAIKEIHPWVSAKELKSIGGSSKALANAGLALPGYHFRCRCAVDIDVSVGSYSALGATDL
jgi:SPP1 gp7 family putative phage head morphogenesis protein